MRTNVLPKSIRSSPTRTRPARSAASIGQRPNTLLSRLDHKEQGAIIVVMQRLHVGDLAGHFLAQGGCQHLNLPAIAEVEEMIEIGSERYHVRKVGDLLHAARESRATLDLIKAGMGSATFSAQYQQSPPPWEADCF